MVRIVLISSVLVLSGCDSPVRHRSHVGSSAPEAPPARAVAPETLPPARTVRFTTADGVHIVGTLAPAARPEAPAVVLLHQLSSDRSEWAPLIERLHTQPALTTLAIDMRAHGESTEGPSGPLDWHAFDDAAWAATQEDVLAAVAYLRSADSGVQPSSFAAIGSSIGSSAVIAAAAREPALATLVTLSPGRAYHGFDAITPAIELVGRAILPIVAQDDSDGVDTAQAYARIGHGSAVIIDGDAHGVALFALDPNTLTVVDAFVRTHLGAPLVGDPLGQTPPTTETARPE